MASAMVKCRKIIDVNKALAAAVALPHPKPELSLGARHTGSLQGKGSEAPIARHVELAEGPEQCPLRIAAKAHRLSPAMRHLLVQASLAFGPGMRAEGPCPSRRRRGRLRRRRTFTQLISLARLRVQTDETGKADGYQSWAKEPLGTLIRDAKVQQGKERPLKGELTVHSAALEALLRCCNRPTKSLCDGNDRLRRGRFFNSRFKPLD